jgi:hypothetical protein
MGGGGGGGVRAPMLGMIPLVIRVILYTDKKENKIFLLCARSLLVSL